MFGAPHLEGCQGTVTFISQFLLTSSSGILFSSENGQTPHALRLFASHASNDGLRNGVHQHAIAIWEIWQWLKIKQEGFRRFWSMFPRTDRVPFWYRFFEPQPYIFIHPFSVHTWFEKHVAAKLPRARLRLLEFFGRKSKAKTCIVECTCCACEVTVQITGSWWELAGQNPGVG